MLISHVVLLLWSIIGGSLSKFWHRVSTLSLPKATILNFCKKHRSGWDAHTEPSHQDLRCLTFSISTLHIDFFESDSLLKKTKKKQTTNDVCYLAPKTICATLSENVHVHPAKIQISLCIRAVWSEPSQGAIWIAKNPKFLHLDNEDSDQTARKRRLIWVFAGRTCQNLHFLTL